jgi:hypothetical protein
MTTPHSLYTLFQMLTTSNITTISMNMYMPYLCVFSGIFTWQQHVHVLSLESLSSTQPRWYDLQQYWHCKRSRRGLPVGTYLLYLFWRKTHTISSHAGADGNSTRINIVTLSPVGGIDVGMWRKCISIVLLHVRSTVFDFSSVVWMTTFLPIKALNPACCTCPERMHNTSMDTI